MKYFKSYFLGIIIPIAFIFLGLKPKDTEELPLPTGYNSLFAGSGECLMCHNSMVDENGNNIGILNYWKSTMMGNASKDPFWRAKVSYEVIKNPELENEIETTCTRCHAPQGSFNAFHNGQAHYSMAELYADPLANDGVSCTVCHQILEESHGNYSGNIEFGTNQEIFGPYANIFPNPMINNTGYTPVYSSHIKDSELCANCHTLLTPTVDLNGQLTGTYYTEQAVYQEWKNSFAFNNEISCQDCHIPEIDESVVISTMPPWLEGQSPFGKHELVGGNVFMLNILKNNIDELGLTAGEEDFDATINRTLTKLQQESINLNLEITERTNDTLFLDVHIENKAGHKVPTGYPRRQIFVQVEIKNDLNETIFISGAIDENGQIINEAFPYEPHHNIINSESQTQIYQTVMSDVEGNVTTTLLHADHSLKDNRLVPEGFSLTHPSYDTIAILGQVVNDHNFNENQNGADIISYHIPLNSYAGELTANVSVFYQSVNSRWLNEMFAETSEEIDAFENMYNDADLSPVLMTSENIISQALGIHLNPEKNKFNIYPNPANETIRITDFELLKEVNVYNYNGKICNTFSENNLTNELYLNVNTGIYLLEMTDEFGNKFIKKLIKN